MTIYSLDVLLFLFEPVYCSMSNSNCCFLTCTQISQETGQVVCYSHLFQNFPVYCDPHKGFSRVSEAEVDVFFWNSLVFSMIQWMLAIWSLVPLSFLFFYMWKFSVHILLLLLLLSRFSRVRLCATPEMVAHQAPPSLGFSRQEHWNGLLFPSPMHKGEKWKWSHSVVSDSEQPHGLQPPRLFHPWDFPGKSTGVGCHCLFRTYCWSLTWRILSITLLSCEMRTVVW